MLISKLKPNDSVSLVIFNDEATTVFDQTLKSDLGMATFDYLNNIHAGGGTTIINGFKKSKEILDKWISSKK
jgi:Mg-chelatase subunit ChlD